MKNQLRQWWRKRRSDLAPLVAISVAFIATFGPTLFRGHLYLGGDSFVYSYPLRTVVWRMLRHGELPLWTPDIMSGYPLLSMAQLGIGYPLTWIYLFLPSHVAEQIYVLLPFLLIPIFTYAYVRELGCSRPAALLAGLSFGYGGATTNLMGLIGMPNHSVMWLPLLLLFIERARSQSFARCLFWAAIVYGLSVLNGHGQLFLHVGLVGLAYAAIISLSGAGKRSEGGWNNWKPLAVCIGAVAIGSGLAAFQILETMAALRQSVRSSLKPHEFVDGYFSPAVAFKSLVAPLFTPRYADVTTYAAPLVCLLAIFACGYAFAAQERERRLRIWLWLGVAVVAAILIVGPRTPLYPLLYHVPVLNLFRVPSRFAFEWTFALSILAAFGWDAAGTYLRRDASGRRAAIFSVAALLLLAVVALVWWRVTLRSRTVIESREFWYSGSAISSYLWWKLGAVLLTLVAFWQSWRITKASSQSALLMALIVLACMNEPWIMITNWWASFAKTSARVTTPASLTRYLQQINRENNRVYTRFDLFTDEKAEAPRIDPMDLTAMYGLRNVAGYEPLLLDRYSRALGNVGLDSVNAAPGYPANDLLFGNESHVLDLLNTTYVASFPNLHTNQVQPDVYGGVPFDLTEAGKEITPGTTALIGLPDTTADSLAIVSSLANSSGVEQGAVVARVRVFTVEGHVIERDIRAGEETAEWAHDRPDVKAMIRHQSAPVFDRQAGDLQNSYQANRYFAQILFDERLRVRRIEVVNVSDHVSLALWAATLRDSVTGKAETLSRRLLNVQEHPERWRTEHGLQDLLILRNLRACPRAWLVAEAEAVSSEEALRRILGESKFDPSRVALLEVNSNQLPQLPGGPVATNSGARVLEYRANRLLVETDAPTATVLVLSEIFYPGWEATIDGKPAQIFVTDYLLRGVALPAGRHRIEMIYRPPAARKGAIISIAMLVVLAGLASYLKRRRE